MRAAALLVAMGLAACQPAGAPVVPVPADAGPAPGVDRVVDVAGTAPSALGTAPDTPPGGTSLAAPARAGSTRADCAAAHGVTLDGADGVPSGAAANLSRFQACVAAGAR